MVNPTMKRLGKKLDGVAATMIGRERTEFERGKLGGVVFGWSEAYWWFRGDGEDGDGEG